MVSALKIQQVATKEEFRYLCQTDNYLAAGDLSRRLALNVFLLTGMVGFFEHSALASAIFWYMYAVQLHFWGAAGLGHEAFHSKVFSSKKLNKILYACCSAVTWQNSELFASSHSIHHSKTFSKDDHEAHSETRWDILDVIFYITFDVRSFFRRTYFSCINSIGLYPNLIRIKNEKVINAARITVAFNLCFLLLIFLITESLVITLMSFIAPFCGALLNKILAKSQHHGLSNERLNGPLAHTRTLKLPPFLSFLYANMNYHAEHHLAPSIPYYNLPKLHDKMVKNELITPLSLIQFLKYWRLTSREQKGSSMKP